MNAFTHSSLASRSKYIMQPHTWPIFLLDEQKRRLDLLVLSIPNFIQLTHFAEKINQLELLSHWSTEYSPNTTENSPKMSHVNVFLLLRIAFTTYISR